MLSLLRSRVVVHGLFGLALIGASLLGRAVVLPDSSLALIWPASGVGFLWMVWARQVFMSRVVTLAGILVITFGMNALTDSGLVRAFFLGVGNGVQTGLAGWLFLRLVPAAGLRVAAHYLWLLLAAVLGASAGGLVVAGGLFLSGIDGWQVFFSWLVRNSAGLCSIGAAGLLLGRRWRQERYSGSSALGTEILMLVVVTAGMYGVLSWLPAGVPIAFVLLAPAVWASLRLSTPAALVYSLASGAVLVVLTLAGAGPFGGSGTAAAYVAQFFLLVFFSIAAILALARDERHALITDLRTSRSEAQNAARLRDLVIERMGDGVYVSDTNGAALMQNDAARELLARDAPRTAGELSKHYGVRTEAGEPYPEEELPLVRALQGETVFRAPMRIDRPDGTVLHLSVDAAPLPISASPGGIGPGVGAVAVFRNVTEELQHQQRLSTFASTVAHDLQNPITVFKGWLELLEDDAITPTQRTAFRAMRSASTRMSNLITSLLTYSAAKNDTITTKPVHLGRIAADMAALRTAAVTTAPEPDTAQDGSAVTDTFQTFGHGALRLSKSPLLAPAASQPGPRIHVDVPWVLPGYEAAKP